jgi:type IV pilus assembly protein PilY1
MKTMKHAIEKVHGKRRFERLGAFIGATLLSVSTLHSSLAWSAQVPIADVPLSPGVSVRPNVFFEVDDSGSTDFQIRTRRYWHACAYDSNDQSRNGDDDCEGFQIDGLFNGYDGANYDLYYYMYDDSDSVYNRPEVLPDAPDITDADWRILSSDFNTLYFNPTLEYEPWPDESDQSFTAARADPDPPLEEPRLAYARGELTAEESDSRPAALADDRSDEA